MNCRVREEKHSSVEHEFYPDFKMRRITPVDIQHNYWQSTRIVMYVTVPLTLMYSLGDSYSRNNISDIL